MNKKVWKTIFAAPVIMDMVHPEYVENITNWEKYRYTFAGGHDFVDKYLQQFSTKENAVDFQRRRLISYCPAHAKASLMDVKNAIYQRMVDIKRDNGPVNYQKACQGEDNGVDYTGNSMNSFIGRLILPELLSMAKVGVFVDKEPINLESSRAETREYRPYIYMYRAEDIRSWSISKQGVLTSLLLVDHSEQTDEETGLVLATNTQYRHLRLTTEGVQVRLYNSKGEITSDMLLRLKRIPFITFELTHSLLVDVADYQIALLQLASSDIHYSWKSNYPFYIEQFDMVAEMSMLRQAMVSDNATTTTGTGTSSEAQTAKGQQLDLGTRQGRRYPKGVDAPAFIHPSSEPLTASMKKQDQMKEEIRQLINLALTSVESRRSAESKKEDSKSLEAGLSYIGLELEYGERQIASIWSEYEDYSNVVTVTYPNNYSLKTDSERRTESKELREELPKIPSKTYQKEMAKQIVEINMGHKVDTTTLAKMKKEIEESEVVVTDPEIIIKDHEAGFVGTQLASELRGYPKGEAETAKTDHAERLARIAAAQSDPQSRGVADASGTPNAGSTEKQKAGMKDTMGTPEDITRGQGAK